MKITSKEVLIELMLKAKLNPIPQALDQPLKAQAIKESSLFHSSQLKRMLLASL
jgi:hypothetical protein